MATKKNTAIEEPRHISDTEMAAEAMSTMAKLRAQPRVRFTVMPDGSGDKKIRVKLNGTVWEYPVGREAEAPRDVYELIATRWKAIEQKEAFERRNENRDMGAL